MLRNEFDSQKSYRYVRYGRMSDDNQNPRSPQQQFEEIDRVLQRLGYPWGHTKDYRDDGMSGRLFHKRPEFQRMLHELKTGIVVADLILVDTNERFARLDDLPEVRRDLQNHHGILILAANTGFADPNTPQGRAYGAVESIRATEEGRVKAHHVLRGKRDAIRQKRWPGGPVPFGFQLEERIESRNGRTVPYNVLVPDPERSWIVALAFELAYEYGYGQNKIARHLNNHPDIRGKHKKFQSSTVGRWLKNPLYCGIYVWPDVATDIVDDSRVIQRVPEEEKIHVEDYCEPLVSCDTFNALQQRRQQRSEARERARQANQDTPEKLIKPPAPGLALRYPLSGLPVCGYCGRAMNASSSPIYVTKDGEEKRYTSYRCPVHPETCVNSQTVPEDWLRQTVFARLRERFELGDVDADGLHSAEWFAQLLEELREELAQLARDLSEEAPALRQEMEELQEQIRGWKASLGNPHLSEAVRREIEQDYERALARAQQIENELSENTNRQAYFETLLDPAPAAERLVRLKEGLDGDNPSAANVEIALHLDRIECQPDGRVIVRICRLGVLPDVAELLKWEISAREDDDTDPDRQDGEQAVPRRRSRRRVDTAGDRELQADAHRALDPARFAGLDEKWFWIDEFQVPEKKSWAKTNAAEVFHRRQQAKLSYAKLADEFGVTKPTIKAAIEHYLDQHPDAKDEVNLPRGGQRPHKFDVTQFGNEARTLREAGWSKLKLAEKYGCSPPTIDKALTWAYAQDGLPLPTAADRKQANVAKARQMLDAEASLDEITEQLGVSDVTARQYLRDSFAREGKPMPDLRSRRKRE